MRLLGFFRRSRPGKASAHELCTLDLDRLLQTESQRFRGTPKGAKESEPDSSRGIHRPTSSRAVNWSFFASVGTPCLSRASESWTKSYWTERRALSMRAPSTGENVQI